MTLQETPVAATDALPAVATGTISTYLAEQRRRVHIGRDTLLRQQLRLRQDHIEGWRAESLGREIRDAETVERWLDKAIRDLGARS